MRRRAGRGWRDEAGTGTLEFSLVIPVLLIVMLAALDFTRALLAYSTIGNASREGVRYAVLHPASDTARIEQEVESRAGPLSRDALSVVVEYSQDNGATFASWPASQSRPPRTVTVRVSVRYPWQATSAMAAGFFAATSGSAALMSEARMDMRR